MQNVLSDLGRGWSQNHQIHLAMQIHKKTALICSTDKSCRPDENDDPPDQEDQHI